MTNKQTKDFANVDFNQAITDFKGKPIESRSLLSDGIDPEDGAEVIEEISGGKTIRVQVVKQTYADIIGNALSAEQTNKDKSGKEKMKNAKLAERIFLADGPVSISAKQAESIINSVGDIFPPMYLMKVAELIDPNDKIGLFND